MPGLAVQAAPGLPYNLVLSPRPATSASTGTVMGQFGGVPVAGTYNGNSSRGTLTLTVEGTAFVEGAYGCSNWGCVFTGTLAGKRVAGVAMSSLNGVGQATSGEFPNREAWIAAVSNWANIHLGSDQAASVVSAAASVKMQQTLNEQGQGSDRSSGEGGGGGMGR